MTVPPPRKRIQIHLSTAIVMMFVAGGLIWANVTPCTVSKTLKDEPTMDNPHLVCHIFGWPKRAFFISDEGMRELRLKAGQSVSYWYRWSVVINLTVAAAILFAVWFLCEWLIRRRAARK